MDSCDINGQNVKMASRYPSLRNRLVVISGGATGIGRSMVETFARQEARVVFLDIQDAPALDLIHAVVDGGAPEPHYVRCDLVDVAQIRNAASAILEIGIPDVLVNNAGNDMRHSIDEVTPEFWEQMMALNLRHHFFLTQCFLPAMRKQLQGSIINMSSIGWMIPSLNQIVYVTAKAAIVGLTRTLAHELGIFNIRVNCIMPGAVETERQQRLWLTDEYKSQILDNQALKRMIKPEEVARLALFLASDDSAAITNQSLVIDSGWI